MSAMLFNVQFFLSMLHPSNWRKASSDKKVYGVNL